MGHWRRLRLIVLHNSDFPTADDPEFASRADVENAARDIARGLGERGHEVRLVAVAGPNATSNATVDARASAIDATLRAITEAAPDLVFNLCESLGGDARHEAVLPSLFELCGVRYTGSGPLALATALRKDRCKAILAAHGVPTPRGCTIDTASLESFDLPFPVIVKPTREDASTGIWLRSVVHDRAALAERVAEVRARYQQPVLVEQFIPGRELYVSLLGNGTELHALPMHEIDFSEMPPGAPHIVTYDGKWDTASDEYRGTRPVRAERLSPAVEARLHEVARAAFTALELRDYARIDLRLASDGTPYVIDVNPNCDLSEGAGVARAAAFGGFVYAELIERVCRAALARYEGESDVHGLRYPDARRDEPAASHPAAVAAAHGARARSRAAAPAIGQGRAVHARRSVGRARAD
jgi:D-alanine-D-alanine ligase